MTQYMNRIHYIYIISYIKYIVYASKTIILYNVVYNIRCISYIKDNYFRIFLHVLKHIIFKILLYSEHTYTQTIHIISSVSSE